MNMGGFLAIALSILVIFALIFPVVQGNTSVGVFVSLVTSFMAMAQSLTWQLPGMLKEMEQGRQLLGDMKRILELPEYEEKPDSSAVLSFESLEFSHVSFPLSEHRSDGVKGYVLSDRKRAPLRVCRAQRQRQIDDCKADFTLV
ncbi:MAG: hypothetical protein ACLSCO_17955 [Gallintestinimicrobium sp.]